MNEPIGIFDSGIGGLTVFREMRRQLPGEDLIYLGDTARVPYGTKSAETVTRYSQQNVRFLLQQGVKLVVVACNTASAFALEKLQKEFSIPIIGVIHAGVKRVLQASATQRIGIIGTEGTIRSESYTQEILRQAPSAQVFSQACPLFVPLVEEGWQDTAVAQATAETYLAPLRGKIDTLILGCTHYPLLKKVIGQVLGPEVQLIDSAEETAKEVKGLVIPSQKTTSAADRFFVSDSTERFMKVAKVFLKDFGQAEKVEL